MFIVREDNSIPHVRFLRMEGKPTAEDLIAYFRKEQELLAKGAHDENDQLALVIEITDVWPSPMRRQMREFEIAMNKKGSPRPLGMAMVVQNALIRGGFTAYYWIAPAPYPTQMVPEARASYDFIYHLLKGAGLPVPSAVEFEAVAQGEWPGEIAQAGKLVAIERAS